MSQITVYFEFNSSQKASDFAARMRAHRWDVDSEHKRVTVTIDAGDYVVTRKLIELAADAEVVMKQEGWL